MKVSEMMPVFAADFVAYEDMKAYLIDEDADLQELTLGLVIEPMADDSDGEGGGSE